MNVIYNEQTDTCKIITHVYHMGQYRQASCLYLNNLRVIKITLVEAIFYLKYQFM